MRLRRTTAQSTSTSDLVGTRRKRAKTPLVIAGALVAAVLLLACLASLSGALFPLAAPWLSQQLYSSPDKVWGLYIDLYNTEYDEADREHFAEVLSIPFAEGADLTPLDEWVALREKAGPVETYTLTVDLDDVGQVDVDWGNGIQRCYDVSFVDEEGYLIRSLYPCQGRGEP